MKKHVKNLAFVLVATPFVFGGLAQAQFNAKNKKGDVDVNLKSVGLEVSGGESNKTQDESHTQQGFVNPYNTGYGPGGGGIGIGDPSNPYVPNPNNPYNPTQPFWTQTLNISNHFSETNVKRSIGIQAQDYRLKIPKTDGKMEEVEYKVGMRYTHDDVAKLYQYSVNGTCTDPMGVRYTTNVLQASGQGAILKGFKFGDHIFAPYLMGGAEGEVDLQKDLSYSKNPITPQYVYLGTVGEMGGSISTDKMTATLGVQARAGVQSMNSPFSQGNTSPILGMGGSPYGGPSANSGPGGGLNTATGIGVKGRLVTNKVIARGQYETLKSGGVKFENFGCEVMIKVAHSPLMLGVKGYGQVVTNTNTVQTPTGIMGGLGGMGTGSAESVSQNSFKNFGAEGVIRVIIPENFLKSKAKSGN